MYYYLLHSTVKYHYLCAIKVNNHCEIKNNLKITIMKTSMALFTNLTEMEIYSLTMEVKETIENTYQHKPIKQFGFADLWNIQRNKRSKTTRRYFI
jgi:hypothetical protein